MPVVSREKVRLFDKIAQKRDYNHTRGGFLKVTTYSSTDRKFRITLPDYMQGVLGRKDVKEDNQKAADDAFRDAVNEYDFRMAHKREVIWFTLLSNVRTEVDGKPFERDTLGLYGYKDQRATGLAIWFAVCYETKFNDDNTWHRGLQYCDKHFNEISKPSFHADMHVMEWTETREAFFHELQSRIAQLAVNAEKFINEDVYLAKIIDSNLALSFLKLGDKEEKKT